MAKLEMDDGVAVARIFASLDYKAVADEAKEAKQGFDAKSRGAFGEDWSALDTERAAVKARVEKIDGLEKLKLPDVYTGRRAYVATKKCFVANRYSAAKKLSRSFEVEGVKVEDLASAEKARAAVMRKAAGKAYAPQVVEVKPVPVKVPVKA